MARELFWDPVVYAVGLEFPEAPVWHDGDLWVSDVSAGGVHRISAAGGREVFLAERRGIGGLVPRSDGGLIASGRNLISVIDSEVIRDRPEFARGLNDLGTDGEGALLVGVLTFRPALGESATPGHVARLTRAGDNWTWRSGSRWPNGITQTPDGSIYYADFATGSLNRAGPDMGPVLVSTTGHLDGIAADCRGRIWAATGPGGTVECWDLHAATARSYPVPAAFVSSVCFGGRDLDRLFITVSGYAGSSTGAVLSCRVPDPGQPVTPAEV